MVGEYPNLEISQMVSSAVSSPGETLTYTINYKNTGNVTATGVFITSSIPNLTSVVSGSISDGGVISGSSILWYIGNIEPGSQSSVSFSAKISQIAQYGDVIINNASITGNQTGSTAATPVYTLISQGSASLSITKKAMHKH